MSKSAFGGRGLLVFALFLARPAPVSGHGDVHDRIDALTRQIASNGPSPELYSARAGLYRLHGELDQALADLDRAEALDPGLPRLELIRGSLLHDAGRSPEALPLLNQYLQIHPDDAEAWLTRARIHHRLGDGVSAIADYDAALVRLDPPPPDCFLERADVQLATGTNQVDSVLRGLDEGIRILGSIPSLQNRAIDLELARGDPAAALDRLRLLIQLSPHNAELLCRQGEILEQSGDRVAAIAAYRAARSSLESLPASRRATRSVNNLEQRIRQHLTRLCLSGCIK